jgi:hypothetical protein
MMRGAASTTSEAYDRCTDCRQRFIANSKDFYTQLPRITIKTSLMSTYDSAHWPLNGTVLEDIPMNHQV